jgi:S-adenosylmethionine:tRNA ribosyltransferase-isomerase
MKPDPAQLRITDYSYELPEEKIARHPLAQRDASKLLVYAAGRISEKRFADLPGEIPGGSLLVFNTTRVVRARLLMQRSTGAQVEIFCTDAADPSVDFTRLLQVSGEAEIRAFVGNAKRWKEQEELQLQLEAEGKPLTLYAMKLAAHPDQYRIRLRWEPAEISFAGVLDAAGKIPLPPYLGRDEELEDAERYQTVYADAKGSVAAPTAGLHFTPGLIEKLVEQQVRTGKVTLHVGAGTFKPVKSETMQEHEMHREQIIVSRALIEMLLQQQGKPVVVVGTTALRTLESIYWFGRQLVLNPGRYAASLFVSQWQPYEGGPDVPVAVALRTVLDWMQEYNHPALTGYTQLLIAPGYSFRIVNGLITNFHQPQSTLLLLVAAFIGEDFRNVYEYALQHDFRFLSYGDSSLLWRS